MRILLSLVLILSLSSTLSFSSEHKEWTFMVFLNGDNNLAGNGLKDLQDMIEVGSTSNVNIVVLADIYGEKGSEFSPKITKTGLVKGAKSRPKFKNLEKYIDGENLEDVNMGSPDTLEDFVKKSITNYPANNYLLIIWNHGWGFKGVSFDDNMSVVAPLEIENALPLIDRFGSCTKKYKKEPKEKIIMINDLIDFEALYKDKNQDCKDFVKAYKEMYEKITEGKTDNLTMSEIKKALKNVNKHLRSVQDPKLKPGLKKKSKLDIVAFDACVMGVIESAYELRDASEYFVGSIQFLPSDGYDYLNLLKQLTENPSVEPQSLADLMGETIVTSYNNGGLQTSFGPVSLMSIKQSKMREFANRFNKFTKAFKAELTDKNLETLLSIVLLSYGDNSYADFFDLDIGKFVYYMKNMFPASPQLKSWIEELEDYTIPLQYIPTSNREVHTHITPSTELYKVSDEPFKILLRYEDMQFDECLDNEDCIYALVESSFTTANVVKDLNVAEFKSKKYIAAQISTPILNKYYFIMSPPLAPKIDEDGNVSVSDKPIRQINWAMTKLSDNTLIDFGVINLNDNITTYTFDEVSPIMTHWTNRGINAFFSFGISPNLNKLVARLDEMNPDNTIASFFNSMNKYDLVDKRTYLNLDFAKVTFWDSIFWK